MKALAIALLTFASATPAWSSPAFLNDAEDGIYCSAHAQVLGDYAAKNGEPQKAKDQKNLRNSWRAYIVKVAKKHGINASKVERIIQSEYEEYKDTFEEVLDWEGPLSLELEGTGCSMVPQQ